MYDDDEIVMLGMYIVITLYVRRECRSRKYYEHKNANQIVCVYHVMALPSLRHYD